MVESGEGQKGRAKEGDIMGLERNLVLRKLPGIHKDDPC